MVKILNMGNAVGVVPELQYVLDRIAVKKPLFVFEALEFRDLPLANEGKTQKWVKTVTVLQDAEEVGSIEHRLFAGRIGSEGQRPDAFIVESTHIKKERGRRNSHVTSDANVAVKTAVKHFAPASHELTCENMLRRLNDGMDSILYRSRSALAEVVSYREIDIRVFFIARHLKGKDAISEVPDPESLTIREDKLHNYDIYLAGKYLSNAYSAAPATRRGYAVWELKDKSFYVVPANYATSKTYRANVENGVELKRYRNFDDLPVEIQKRVAVLKIAQMQEPITDIGVKISDTDNLMYIAE
jgi:hypothetical protein